MTKYHPTSYDETKLGEHPEDVTEHSVASRYVLHYDLASGRDKCVCAVLLPDGRILPMDIDHKLQEYATAILK